MPAASNKQWRSCCNLLSYLDAGLASLPCTHKILPAASSESCSHSITQPEGPSWELDGNHVKWQQWDLRVGFNYREGLVLHQIGCAGVTFPARRICSLLSPSLKECSQRSKV